MQYVKNEFKRLSKVKAFIVFLIFITLTVYLGANFFGEDFYSVYKNMISNYFLVCLILVSASTSTDDFEMGTCKLLVTGKYSLMDIINLKVLVIVWMAFLLSILSGVIDSVAVWNLKGNFDVYVCFKVMFINNVKYCLVSMVVAVFALLIGKVSKKFNITLVLMVVLFYGIVARIVNILSSYGKFPLSKGLKYLPFTVVPNVMINNELTSINIMVLIFSFSVIYVAIALNEAYRQFSD